MKFIKSKSIIVKAKDQMKKSKGIYHSKKSELMDKCFKGSFNQNNNNFGCSLTSNALGLKKNKEARNRFLLRTFAQKLMNKAEKHNIFGKLDNTKIFKKNEIKVKISK